LGIFHALYCAAFDSLHSLPSRGYRIELEGVDVATEYEGYRISHRCSLGPLRARKDARREKGARGRDANNKETKPDEDHPFHFTSFKGVFVN
jgi:hypothetical protein